MASWRDQDEPGEGSEPRFDRYLLERGNRPLALLLSDGRHFVMHAVAEEAFVLEGRCFTTVAAAERALDHALMGGGM